MELNVSLIEDGDDLILPLGFELCESLGWKIGDTIKFEPTDNGGFIMSKVEKTELVLVETVGMFRHRYLVEVPAGKVEYALDTVTCDEAVEVSQKWLGETITSHRIVSNEEVLGVINEDNDCLKSWTDEQKLEYFITKPESLK